MITPAFALTLALVAALGATDPSRVDFGRELTDWNLFDADGDGDEDVIAFFQSDSGSMSFTYALQEADRTYRILEEVALPRGTVAIALGRFRRPAGVDVAAIAPKGVSFIGVVEGAVVIRPDVLAATTVFRASGRGAPQLWHWPTDVDGDGHDDLHLPGEDGIIIAFGDSAGGLSATVDVALGGERRVTNESAGLFDFAREYPHPVLANVAGDERADLCWFDEAGLSFCVQEKPRSFAAPGRFELPWLASGDVGGVMEQTDVDLQDLDGNGRADLVLGRMRTEQSKIGDMKTTLLVLMNRAKDDEPFGRQPQTAILLRGVVGIGPQFRDVDGDGHLDLVMGSYGASLSDAVSRFLGRVPATLYVHRGTGRADEPFSPTPTVTEETNVAAKDFERWGIRHSLALHEDFTGDDVADFFEMTRARRGHQATIRRGAKQGEKLVITDETVAEVTVEGVEGVSFRALRTGAPKSVVLATKTGLVFLTVD